MDSNLLKEAIADAKAVRQTALANAKVALEEAFSERYQAMFAQKLKEDATEENNMNGTQAEVNAEPEENISEQEIDELIKELEGEVGGSENPEPEPGAMGGNEPAVPGADASMDEPQGAPGAEGAPVPPGYKPAPGAIVPIDPVDGAEAGAAVPPTPPVGGEVPPSEVPPTAGEEEDEDVNLDELLQSLKEEVEEDEEEESKKDLKEDKKLSTSAISPGGNKKPSASAQDTSGIGDGGDVQNGIPGGKTIAKDPTEVTKAEKNFDGNKDGNMAKNSPLKEGIGLKDKGIPGGKQTSGEDPSDVTKDENNFNGNKDGDMAKTPSINELKKENKTLKTQLGEAYDTVKYVKGQLNEINLLNAKLLYTNKLFKEHGMDNEQKMRIVEMFDLAKNVREVKLTYANFAESLNFGAKGGNKKAISSSSIKNITEGLASKPVGGTKPTKELISESKTSNMVAHFQKLAGIKLPTPKK